MSKQTNPNWPDPTDWAKRLHDRLEGIGGDFMDAPWEVADDPEDFSGLNLKQARAAEALMAVCSALQELPQFQKSKGASTIHTVAGALRDVVMGGEAALPHRTRSTRPVKDHEALGRVLGTLGQRLGFGHWIRTSGFFLEFGAGLNSLPRSQHLRRWRRKSPRHRNGSGFLPA